MFCVDEKTAIQALDRPDPALPLSPGRLERHGFEYRRNGTLSLYAALEVKIGKVQGRTAERHTSTEFVGFLEQIVSGCTPGQEIHIILDNLSAHKTSREHDRGISVRPACGLFFAPDYDNFQFSPFTSPSGTEVVGTSATAVPEAGTTTLLSAGIVLPGLYRRVRKRTLGRSVI